MATMHSSQPFNIVCLYWVKSELSVCFEWAEERNDLIQIIGDSDTILQVDPKILNIIDKSELNYWLWKLVVKVRKKTDAGNI